MNFSEFYYKINEGLLKSCSMCDEYHGDNGFRNSNWLTIIDVNLSADKNEICGYKKCPVYEALKCNHDLYERLKRKSRGRVK